MGSGNSAELSSYGHLLGFVISQLDKPAVKEMIIKDILYRTKIVNLEDLRRLRSELKDRKYAFVRFFHNDRNSIRIVTSLQPFNFVYSADKEIIIEK